MISPAQGAVCVIIAAKNAADTISRAIGSALREPQVGEVIVVDDGSTDATAACSKVRDDGTGRLRVFSLAENRGPAFARNYAIARSTAPLISVLDADDFFLQGRFANILDVGGWDFIADNILFVDACRAEAAEPDVPRFMAEPRLLDFCGFIEGNISKRGAQRGEIGFLKPVMRRSFLDAHGLRYDENLRLGEDYALYARALIKGARFKITHACGYGAVVRADSLSGRHRTVDLERLCQSDQALLAMPGLQRKAAAALRRHERHIRARYELRRFLDVKAERGLRAAGFHALKNPSALPAVVAGVAADKFEAYRSHGRPTAAEAGCGGPRFLLAGRLAADEPAGK
jgi:succinoglycan biosynthesis protein ExoU